MNPTDAHDEHEHHGGPTDVESEGINTGFVFQIMLGTIVVVIILATTGFSLARVKSIEIRNAATAAIEYPEIREVRSEGMSRLSQFARVDGATDVYRIPIEEAIKMMANEAHAAGDAAASSSQELRLTQPRP